MKRVYEGDFELGGISFRIQNNKNLFNMEKFNAALFSGPYASHPAVTRATITLNFV